MIKDAIDNAITAGTDVTEKYLVNADFEAKNGWTSQHASGGNVNYGGNSKNHCFEAYNNSNFDVYQEVSDAPVGVYTISVAGFSGTDVTMPSLTIRQVRLLRMLSLSMSMTTRLTSRMSSMSTYLIRVTTLVTSIHGMLIRTPVATALSTLLLTVHLMLPGTGILTA